MNTDKNYRVGWVIPNQVAALTHYTSDILLDEFQAIAGEAGALATSATETFHMIIDNRIMNMAFLPDLATIKRAAPYANTPHLQYIIIIKPEQMEGSANDLPSYTDAHLTLTYVDTLADAVNLLKAEDSELRWHEVESDFFPNAKFG